MEQAYLYLVHLIDCGYEFPDALWKATSRFKVDSTELTEMYDNSCK